MQCKQPYVNHFYQSCYAYHSIWIEWIWALFAIIVRHAQRFVALLVYRRKKNCEHRKRIRMKRHSPVKFSCNDKLVEKKCMALFHYNSPFGIETCIHIYYLLNFLSPCNKQFFFSITLVPFVYQINPWNCIVYLWKYFPRIWSFVNWTKIDLDFFHRLHFNSGTKNNFALLSKIAINHKFST